MRIEADRSPAAVNTVRREYAHPPAVEVVIDLRVTPTRKFKPRLLDPLIKAESKRYPQVAQTFSVELSGKFTHPGVSGTTEAKREHIGYRIEAPGRTHVIQLQQEGFTFSRLQPYIGWEATIAEARRVWKHYEQLANPLQVNRLGVRYINRLDIPLPAGDISRYLLTAPALAANIPQQISGYAMELQLPQPDLPKTTAVMRQGLTPPPRDNVLSIILDIDVFKAVEFPASYAGIWNEFETLHRRENFLFESTITDTVRELLS
jgi:uncharacterized protein (TIGR04255 family)